MQVADYYKKRIRAGPEGMGGTMRQEASEVFPVRTRKQYNNMKKLAWRSLLSLCCFLPACFVKEAKSLLSLQPSWEVSDLLRYY
jgi:hypothetical protein